MPIVFSSKAAAQVLMLSSHAQALLEAVGKDPQAPQGIFVAADLPASMAALQQAVAQKDAVVAAKQAADAEIEGDADAPAPAQPTWAARAYPLLQMMQAAQAQGVPVIWEKTD